MVVAAVVGVVVVDVVVYVLVVVVVLVVERLLKGRGGGASGSLVQDAPGLLVSPNSLTSGLLKGLLVEDLGLEVGGHFSRRLGVAPRGIHHDGTSGEGGVVV